MTFRHRRRPHLSRECAGQVGMAAMMIILARQQGMRVGIAACPNDIVYTAPICVDPVPIQRVRQHRRQGAERRKGRPKSIARGDMCPMQSTGLPGIEALVQVVRVPQIEVPNLRPIHGQNAKDLPGLHTEGCRFPRWNTLLGDLYKRRPRLLKIRSAWSLQGIGWVTHDRCRLPSKRCIGRLFHVHAVIQSAQPSFS